MRQSRLVLLRATDEFQPAVALYRREIDEGGQEFKIKARKLASVVLEELATIAVDDDASHADRISAIRELARLAGYGEEETGQQARSEERRVGEAGGVPEGGERCHGAKSH